MGSLKVPFLLSLAILRREITLPAQQVPGFTFTLAQMFLSGEHYRQRFNTETDLTIKGGTAHI